MFQGRLEPFVSAERPEILDFFDMGGYGAYIWPAYGVVAVTMIGLLVASLRTRSRLRGELDALEEAGHGRRRARAPAASEETVE